MYNGTVLYTDLLNLYLLFAYSRLQKINWASKLASQLITIKVAIRNPYQVSYDSGLPLKWERIFSFSGDALGPGHIFLTYRRNFFLLLFVPSVIPVSKSFVRRQSGPLPPPTLNIQSLSKSDFSEKQTRRSGHELPSGELNIYAQPREHGQDNLGLATFELLFLKRLLPN